MVLRGAIAVSIALCVAAAGARELQQAPSPAPTALPVADTLFILSAGQAKFTDANHLALQNPSSSAQYYGAGAHAGVVPSGTFLNGTLGAPYVAADGMWLDNPTATLIGINSENAQQAIVLRLADPLMSSDHQVVTFMVTKVGKEAIKTSRGVANDALKETGELATAVQPGAALSDAAIFVDFNRESFAAPAKEELGGTSFGGGHTGGGYVGGGGHFGSVNGAAYARSGNDNQGNNWNNGWGNGK